MRLRNKITLSCIIFFLTYLIALVIWLQIKPYYANIQAHFGAFLSARTIGFRVLDVKQENELSVITFSRAILTEKGLADLVVDLKIAVSHYSFNVPLTFALVASLSVFFKWRIRFLVEAFFILLFIHLLYIYSFCNLNLAHQISMAGAGTPPKPVQYLLQFMWAFTDNMVLRFEPFLVAVYLWLRNREPANSPRSKKRKKK